MAPDRSPRAPRPRSRRLPPALLALVVTTGLAGCAGLTNDASGGPSDGGAVPAAVTSALPGAAVERAEHVIVVRAAAQQTASAASTTTSEITPAVVEKAREAAVRVWGAQRVGETTMVVVVPATIEQYAALVGRQSNLPPARTQGLGVKKADTPWTVVHPDLATTLTQAEVDDILVHEMTHVVLDNPVGRRESVAWREAVAEWAVDQTHGRAGCLDARTILDVDDQLRSERGPTVRQALAKVTRSSRVPECITALEDRSFH